MPDRYTIASLNRLITIRHISIAKNDKGLPIKLITSQQTTFASFQQIANSYTLQMMQVSFGEAWEAVVRFLPNRIIYPIDDILYNGKQYIINGILPVEEGNMQWLVIRCVINNRNGTNGTGEPITPGKEIYVTGDVVIGDETYANWQGTIIAFRDGSQYHVKRDGSAAGREINYDVNTGIFTYPVDFAPLQDDEATNIYFL